MSHDQRPGKMRVVSTVEVQRRRDDPADSNDAALQPVPALAAPAPRSRLSLITVALFLIACAGGGFGAFFAMRLLGLA